MSETVIFNMKIGEFDSPNTHGLEDVVGTTYKREAIEKALLLYEGCPVYRGQPADAEEERLVADQVGVARNVRIGKEGWYADLYLLTDMDPAAEVVRHNVLGVGKVEGDRFVIEEIRAVRSLHIKPRDA